VIELCCIRLIDGVSCHMPQCFRILPRLDQFRNWRPVAQYFCNKCYVLANFSVKNVSATLWFCLQCSCKKCL